MQHLALNVYLPGWDEQTSLLSAALAPALASLRDTGMLRRAWFTRFDARGPHLFVVVSVDDGRADETRHLLAGAIDGWLAANPEREPLDDAAREQRHAECRGKRLCALDAEPGFAEPGTYACVPQPATAYPFFVVREDDDAVWALLTGLALDNAGGPPAGCSASAAGMRWLAAVDHALAAAGADAADYWRYHATTLLPGLPERLQADEAAVLDALPRTVGERNLAALGRVWSAVDEDGGEPADRARLLVDALLSTREPARAWPVLREASHCGLLQLGLGVRSHVAPVLYGWQRALRPAAA